LCNLDPDAEYRINKYIYGLPDSGRAFYYLYKSVLEKEGYREAGISRYWGKSRYPGPKKDDGKKRCFIEIICY